MSRLLREAESVKHGYLKLEAWLGTLSRSKLQKLAIDGEGKLPREDLIRRLGDALPPTIRELILLRVGRMVSPVVLSVLARAADADGANSTLRHLDLSDNALLPTAAEIVALSRALGDAHALLVLNLSENALLSEASAPLLSALGGCRALESLDLSSNTHAPPPKSDAAKARAKAQRRQPSAPAAVGERLVPLVLSHSLRSLKLCRCGLTAAALDPIALVLERAPALRELDLSHSRLGDGLGELAQALTEAKLETLRL
jgi:Leucine-rich repeat (LRR) protein